MIDNNIKLIVIDSFCGAGGVTEGFHRAEINGQKVCKVIIGINHDDVAIASHAANHPDTIHFVEDFTTLDPHKLVDIVAAAKANYPNAKVLFWMSAECTHHSKAKGGMSRDTDSRSLPEHAERYVEVLQPDIIGVENVVEFIDWGPLKVKVICNKKGEEMYCPLDYKKEKKTKKVISIDPIWVPIKERKGEYYKKWRDNLISYGFKYDYRKLNAADFDAYTSRIRYFGIFAKDEVNIQFPIPTSSKTGKNGLKKWNAVKDVLELDIEGESIFTRKKPPVDPTIERVMSGVIKFVPPRKNRVRNNYRLITAYYGNGYNSSVNEPIGTVTTKDRFAIVKIQSMMTYNSPGLNTAITEPCGTVTTKDRFSLITAKFIANQYSGGGQLSDINDPNPPLVTVPKQSIVTCQFMDQQYGNSKPVSIDQPSATITANPKLNLVSAQWLMDTQFRNVGRSLDQPCPTITANRKHFYLMNPQFNNKGASIEKPCFTLIARMDKAPPYLIQTNFGYSKIRINKTDTETMIKLKNLCNEYGITDIFMRMLFIDELLRIQGFGDTYKLKGTKAEMKKFIGNAVECNQARVLAESIAGTLVNELLETA